MTDESQKVIWQAETTHPLIADTVKTALREVLDPEIGLSVIELGLVRDLKHFTGKGSFRNDHDYPILSIWASTPGDVSSKSGANCKITHNG